MIKVKNKKILGILGILLVSIMLIGVAFAFFQYTRTGEEQSQLIAGEVYLHYSDDGNIIHTKPNAFPETVLEARGTEQNPRTDNVMTFTIDGKNTTTNKDIYYEIKLLYADGETGRERFNDSDLRFDLVEKVNGVATRVVDNMSYDSINNTRIWVNKVERNSEIEIEYELRMWISEDVLISDTAPNKTYTTGQYKNLFASVKVMVYGDFEEKTLYPPLYETVETALATNLLPSDGEARIVSGSEVPNNYVSYSNKLWRITALNDDGTIKLVTDETYGSFEYGTVTATDLMNGYLKTDILPTLDNYQNILVTDYEWNKHEIDISNKNDITKPSILTTESPIGLLNLYEYAQSDNEKIVNQINNNQINYKVQFLAVAPEFITISGFNSYLNNGTAWYTLTARTLFDEDNLWYVTDNYIMSSAVYFYVEDSNIGVRPAVVLKAESMYSKGTGSFGNPYVLVTK